MTGMASGDTAIDAAAVEELLTALDELTELLAAGRAWDRAEELRPLRERLAAAAAAGRAEELALLCQRLRSRCTGSDGLDGVRLGDPERPAREDLRRQHRLHELVSRLRGATARWPLPPHLRWREENALAPEDPDQTRLVRRFALVVLGLLVAWAAGARSIAPVLMMVPLAGLWLGWEWHLRARLARRLRILRDGVQVPARVVRHEKAPGPVYRLVAAYEHDGIAYETPGEVCGACWTAIRAGEPVLIRCDRAEPRHWILA